MGSRSWINLVHLRKFPGISWQSFALVDSSPCARPLDLQDHFWKKRLSFQISPTVAKYDPHTPAVASLCNYHFMYIFQRKKKKILTTWNACEFCTKTSFKLNSAVCYTFYFWFATNVQKCMCSKSIGTCLSESSSSRFKCRRRQRGMLTNLPKWMKKDSVLG